MGKASEEGQGPSGAVEMMMMMMMMTTTVMGTPHSIMNVTQTSLLPQSQDSLKSMNN